MKKYFFVLLLSLMTFQFGFSTNSALASKSVLKIEGIQQDKPAQHTKKDGTPDKRYKENKHMKKDGTPDKRYKENSDKKDSGKATKAKGGVSSAKAKDKKS